VYVWFRALHSVLFIAEDLYTMLTNMTMVQKYFII